jgi:hypothetical protein
MTHIESIRREPATNRRLRTRATRRALRASFEFDSSKSLNARRVPGKEALGRLRDATH